MKRVLKWLESKFSWHSSDVEADDHHAPLEVRPEENVKEENSGSGDTATLPILKSSKKSSYIVVESPPSIDPYNSGSFDSSKTRSHK